MGIKKPMNSTLYFRANLKRGEWDCWDVNKRAMIPAGKKASLILRRLRIIKRDITSNGGPLTILELHILGETSEDSSSSEVYQVGLTSVAGTHFLRGLLQCFEGDEVELGLYTFKTDERDIVCGSVQVFGEKVNVKEAVLEGAVKWPYKRKGRSEVLDVDGSLALAEKLILAWEGTQQAKPQGKPEAKPQGKPEAKPQGKPEAKPGKPQAFKNGVDDDDDIPF